MLLVNYADGVPVFDSRCKVAPQYWYDMLADAYAFTVRPDGTIIELKRIVLTLDSKMNFSEQIKI